MITTISSPLRSKRIHVGLDEAAGVGEGRYRQIFGYEDPTRVFLHHLKRVQDICKRLELKPMIWSDSTLLPIICFLYTCFSLVFRSIIKFINLHALHFDDQLLPVVI